MKQRSLPWKYSLWLGGFALFLLVTEIHAAVTCTASSAVIPSIYVPSSLLLNMSSATISVTCHKDPLGKPTSTVTYQLVADNGVYSAGTQKRASFGGNYFVDYSIEATNTCNSLWNSTPTVTLQMVSNQTITNDYPVYVCIPAGQFPPAGLYTDTVNLTFSAASTATGGGSAFINSTFPVSIVVQPSCTLTTPPSNVEFTYTAFSPNDILANSGSFGVKCSTNLPYTMTLDAVVGVAAGLNYSLALSTSGNGGTNPLTSVGTGIAQTFFINGTMAAKQAGACTGATCTDSQVRTLMISY